MFPERRRDVREDAIDISDRQSAAGAQRGEIVKTCGSTFPPDHAAAS
jgi:hypothetical protein